MDQLADIAIKIFYALVGLVSQFGLAMNHLFSANLFNHIVSLLKDIGLMLLVGLEALLRLLKGLF